MSGVTVSDCCQTLDEAKGVIKRLQTWVNDLHSGMYINCVYCGHRYGPREDTPAVMADVLKAHIEKCPQHPLSHAKTEIKRLQSALLEAAKMSEAARSSPAGHLSEDPSPLLTATVGRA